MVKYNEIKIKYDSAPMPPMGIFLDRVYTVFKKYENLYITDGNAEIKISENLIKMLFCIQNKDLTWKDIDFSDKKVENVEYKLQDLDKPNKKYNKQK